MITKVSVVNNVKNIVLINVLVGYYNWFSHGFLLLVYNKNCTIIVIG